MPRGVQHRPALKERFERKVARCELSGCWLWTGCRFKNGHGAIQIAGRKDVASRAAYRLYVGEIPDGLFVCHTCDVRSCVNPEHLFLGTHADNMRDRGEKGRQARHIGETNPAAKLTAEAVKYARRAHAEGVTRKVLAQELGVSVSVLDCAIHGRTWKHVA